jgi:hypothetical protein
LRSSKTSWSAAPAAKNSTADRGVTEAARAPPPTCVVRRAGCLRAPRARARRPSVAASPDRGARRRSTTALVASADNRRASRPDSLPALRLFQRLDRAAAPSVSLALTATDSARSRREASTVRSARRHRCRASSASRRQVSRMAVCASTSSVECIGRRYGRPAQLRTTRSVPFAGRGADTVYRTAARPTDRRWNGRATVSRSLGGDVTGHAHPRHDQAASRRDVCRGAAAPPAAAARAVSLLPVRLAHRAPRASKSRAPTTAHRPATSVRASR